MKKFLATILAIVFLGSSFGATMNLHYCMGKLADWDLAQQKPMSKSCPKCGMEKKNKGCCKDEQKFVKNTIDQNIPGTGVQVLQALACSLPSHFFELPIASTVTLAKTIPVSHAPPEGIGIPAYIRNCVFRI